MIKGTNGKFSIGDMVRHSLQDYRGVIVDVDPIYLGTTEWYEQSALRSSSAARPPKDKPWYHVAVDGQELITYVAERHLALDATDEPVEHPFVDEFFMELRDGVYVPRHYLN